MKCGRDIATNRINQTHRFISKMYVPLSKSSRSIANHIVTNCTAGNFKGFISHPSFKYSFVCLHINIAWKTGGFYTQHRVTSHSLQTGCSAPSPQGPTNCTQPRHFFPQNRTCDLVPASTPAMRTPLQGPVTGIILRSVSNSALCTIWLFISLGYERKAHKQEQQPVLLTAWSLHLDLSLLCYCNHPH